MDYKSFTKEKAFCAVKEFMLLYSEFSTTEYNISEIEKVFVVEDSAIFYIKVDLNCDFMTIEENREFYIQEGVCGLEIEELTKNNILPKYNHSKFVRDFEYKYQSYGTFIRYGRFAGIKTEYLANGIISHRNYVNYVLPQLELEKRLNEWEGDSYSIIAYEMEGISGKVSYAVDAIRGDVHQHILKIADNIIKNSYTTTIGLADIYNCMDNDFLDMFNSYKGERKIKRLQEHFKYFVIERKYFRDLVDIRPYLLVLMEKIKNGDYDYLERVSYIKPEYKWKSEELMYRLIKKIYKNYGVIYQHRPYFLKSSLGGQMSYDVYISGLQVAVEYQGKQHFEPVDFFGGQEAFEQVKIRDKEKAELSKANNISLIYVNYWETITPELIKHKIDAVLELSE